MVYPEMKERCAKIRRGDASLLIIRSNEAWDAEDWHYVATMEDSYWITANKTLKGLMKELDKRKLPVDDIDCTCDQEGCFGKLSISGEPGSFIVKCSGIKLHILYSSKENLQNNKK